MQGTESGGAMRVQAPSSPRYAGPQDVRVADIDVKFGSVFKFALYFAISTAIIYLLFAIIIGILFAIVAS